MRKLKISFFLAVFSLLIIAPACEKEVEEPDGCYTLTVKREGEIVTLTEPYTVEAGEGITFTNCGYADFYSFFSGNPGHVYAEFTDPADTTTTGTDTNSSGDVSVTYSEIGQYTATILLTNRAVGDPDNVKQLAMNFEITVNEPTED